MNTLAVIGLGYVGLPLVVEFGKKIHTIGFDVAKYKVEACQRGQDPSSEISQAQMQQAVHAVYTDDFIANLAAIFSGYSTMYDEVAAFVGNVTTASLDSKR